MRYLASCFKDPLFFRVCMLIWGVPLAAFSGFVLVVWKPVGALEWGGYGFTAALCALGAHLVHSCFFGSDKSVDKAAGFMGDGGDALALLLAAFVSIIAIPVVMLLRAFWPRPGEER